MKRFKIKTLTKRKGCADPIEDARILQKTANALQGGRLVPTGLYCFRSFEEADAWMIKTIAATHAHLKSKIL